MVIILEWIFKGYVQWVYGLCLEIVEYIANSLLDIFQMDLRYFQQVAPVTDDILKIVIAVGWALLLGNLVFQAMKSMATGLGFQGEDPKMLFTRTFVFAFLLLASQQICELGLSISARVIELLQIPSSVTITIPDESNFDLGASWLLIIIIGLIVMWQFVRLCFEVAERYVVTAVLVLLSPLAFAMGGSKNTEDIFKGWCRMFGSMCLMMVMNVIFLKMLISALGYVPTGVAILPWTLLIVGIARVARKIDSIITRIGLNPAITGDGLGRGLPGMVTYAVVKGISSSIAKAAGFSVSGRKTSGGGGAPGAHSTPRVPPPSPPPAPSPGFTVLPPCGSGGGTPPSVGSTRHQDGEPVLGVRTAKDEVYASRDKGEDARPQAEVTGKGCADSKNILPERPNGSKRPMVHTRGSRRSAIPPEARVGTRKPKVYPDATRNVGVGHVDGTLARTEHGRAPDDPLRPSGGRLGTPGGTGGTKPETRRSSVRAQTSGKIAVKSDSRVQRERPSIQQDKTPKIPQPPGIRGEIGKGQKPDRFTPAPSGVREAMRTDCADAGLQPSALTHKAPAASAVPVTAGTRPAAGDDALKKGRILVAGTAGTADGSGHLRGYGGAPPLSGTAGISTASPVRHSSRDAVSTLTDLSRACHSAVPDGSGRGAHLPGSARTAKGDKRTVLKTKEPHETGSVGGARQKRQTASAAKAGINASKSGDLAEVSRGTRRIKGETQPPLRGTAKVSTESRKRRGPHA